jgi:hypothetical protein
MVDQNHSVDQFFVQQVFGDMAADKAEASGNQRVPHPILPSPANAMDRNRYNFYGSLSTIL